MKSSVKVGVIGASGHAGGELCRLLLSHGAVDTILPSSRSDRAFHRAHPNLAGSGLRFLPKEDILDSAGSLDVVFFCTPAGEAMTMAEHFVQAGCRVIDLSPDFRFPRTEVYEQVYGKAHTAAHLLKKAVYGVTELYRDDIRGADLIANPGCYAIASMLALTPALRANLVDLESDIHINAVNGTTGASSVPMHETHHGNVANGMLPYSLDGHRHSSELECQLHRLADVPVNVVMNTQHGPFPRGIQATITVKPKKGTESKLSRQYLTDLYLGSYGADRDGEYFVVVNDAPKAGGKNEKEYHLYPNVARLAGSNYCHIGLEFDQLRSCIKIVVAIDNLGKGAAGSALQNMNVMLGLEESAGLQAFGL